MKTSPTQRTLAALRKEGWTAAVVERWNQHVGIRQDLFGFVDIIACRPGHRPLFVQCTTQAHAAERLAKIIALPAARAVVESQATVEVWGWRKLKVKRGGKAVKWETTRRTVGVEDFARVEGATA